MKTTLCVLAAALVLLPAAQAGTKEELMRLQSEILSLQKQMLEFDKSYNERIDGLRSLIVQLTDEVAKSNNTISRMAAALNSQTDDARTRDKTLHAELDDMTAKLDDAAVSISAMAQQLNELKSQAASSMSAASMTGSSASLSPESLYNQAYEDLVLGNLEMAIEEFTAYVDNYPGGARAADALLYIGEANSNLNSLSAAMNAFTRVINEYPQASAVPTALYKRAQVELAMQDRDSAISDLKDIVDRFPNATEADRARLQLQNMGALRAKAPSAPARRTTTR